MELLLELLLDFLLVFGPDIAIELGMRRMETPEGRPPADSGSRPAANANRGSSTHAVVWSISLLAVGALLGFLSKLVLPARVTPVVWFRGIGLIVMPLAVGLVMHLWGKRRGRRGLPHSGAATFHGGASFAFGMALVRLLVTV